MKYLLGPVEVKGTDIAGADFGLVNTATVSSTNQWAVNLTFNSEGAGVREVTSA